MKDKRTAAGERAEVPGGSAESGGLPAELQNALGRKLREVYGELVNEPLPERFSKLLEQLSRSDKAEPKS